MYRETINNGTNNASVKNIQNYFRYFCKHFILRSLKFYLFLLDSCLFVWGSMARDFRSRNGTGRMKAKDMLLIFREENLTKRGKRGIHSKKKTRTKLT